MEKNSNHLVIHPLDLKTANEFVAKHHRHNGPVTVHRFSIGVYNRDTLVGVAICGNPVARKLCDGLTLEVHRICTDGTYNACSILYARSARIAKEMGYNKIITYILQDECGSSLKASGWVLETENAGSKSGWNVPSRPRTIVTMTLFGIEEKRIPIGPKKRYCKLLNGQ